MSALLHTACPTADLKTFPPCQSWILKRNNSKIGTNKNTSRKHDLKLFILNFVLPWRTTLKGRLTLVCIVNRHRCILYSQWLFSKEILHSKLGLTGD
jgi:hypothetical protein